MHQIMIMPLSNEIPMYEDTLDSKNPIIIIQMVIKIWEIYIWQIHTCKSNYSQRVIGENFVVSTRSSEMA